MVGNCVCVCVCVGGGGGGGVIHVTRSQDSGFFTEQMLTKKRRRTLKLPSTVSRHVCSFSHPFLPACLSSTHLSLTALSLSPLPLNSLLNLNDTPLHYMSHYTSVSVISLSTRTAGYTGVCGQAAASGGEPATTDRVPVQTGHICPGENSSSHCPAVQGLPQYLAV